MKRWTSCIRLRFQSTPSTRRVTKIRDDDWVKIVISIHTLHTEGDRRGMDQGEKYYISIHTLHTEGDQICGEKCWSCKKFQSTPSTRRVTFNYALTKDDHSISIHTLHTEGDNW